MRTDLQPGEWLRCTSFGPSPLYPCLAQEEPKGHGVYNVCTGHKITINELAATVIKLWGDATTSKVPVPLQTTCFRWPMSLLSLEWCFPRT